MKFAICQELFEDWDWERQCRFMAETGYTGIEVAPFTLAGSLAKVSPSQRKELRRVAESHGLQIVGLHWLLAKTQGFHLTTPDPLVRARTADYLVELAQLCADLGGNIMVHGSPQQRNLMEGQSWDSAFANAVDVYRRAAPRIGNLGVNLLIEPLTTKETNFINSCAEGAKLIEAVGHPSVGLHQDVKAMLPETTPIPELIHQFRDVTRHFHVNDSNLLGPGMGPTEYAPILKALLDSGYDGWVSVEVFDYSPGAEKIARESINNMKRVLKELGVQV
jgi:sugar phosphate isomerase/epimerase